LQVMVVCCNIVSPLPFFWVLYVFMNKLKFIVSFIKRRWCKKNKNLTTSMMHQLPFIFLILKLVIAIWNLLFIACNFKRKWATQNLRLFMFSILQKVDICFMYIVFYTHRTSRWITMVNVLFIYLPPYYSSK
jgi:hypothetical protein